MQSKKRPKLFWISAMAPLTSVILGSLLVYLTHAEKHGVQVVSTPIKILTLFLGHIIRCHYISTLKVVKSKLDFTAKNLLFYSKNNNN